MRMIRPALILVWVLLAILCCAQESAGTNMTRSAKQRACFTTASSWVRSEQATITFVPSNPSIDLTSSDASRGRRE